MGVSNEMLYQWYVVERLSYREIMKRLGRNNARWLKQLLSDAGIEPRDRSEAVATQWENNDKRRKQQGKVFKKSSTGNTRRRISDEELTERYKEKDMIFLFREIIEGYSAIHYVCAKCYYRGVQYLGNFSKCGCPSCAVAARTFADQSTVKAARRKTKAWRKSVLVRDDFLCQRCGSTGKLRAHHIENFAENPDLRFEIDNGITLCYHCHDSGSTGGFHRIYGVYHNNGEQLVEFLLQ